MTALGMAALLGVPAFGIGWVSADALDWWHRRRGTRKAKKAAPEGRILPRHLRRQQAKAIARRVTRAMAEPLTARSE